MGHFCIAGLVQRVKRATKGICELGLQMEGHLCICGSSLHCSGICVAPSNASLPEPIAVELAELGGLGDGRLGSGETIFTSRTSAYEPYKCKLEVPGDVELSPASPKGWL